VVLPIRDDNPTSRLAIVTIALIAINIFVYFAVQPHSGTEAANSYLLRYAAIPCELSSGHPTTLAQSASGQCNVDENAIVRTTAGDLPGRTEFYPHKNLYLAVLFSMFLHGSVAHVLGNMLFLWIFGNNIEDRLGPFFFAFFYLAMGVIATMSFVVLNLHSVSPLVGASGAIAGVMGAYLIWFPRARVLSLVGIFPLYIPAFVVLGLWFVLQFATNPNEGVAWQAHVGGFVAGAFVALLLRPMLGPARRRKTSPSGDWDGGFRGGYPGRG
jgi:membrane associated rhomboid family serine protease